MIQLPRDRVIITACVTGAFLTKEMTPAAPVTPDEIIQAARGAYDAGAAIIHIHGRAHDTSPTGDKEIFREIHEGIRSYCDVILQDSTGGGANLSLEERIDCLNALPEMASLNMGTLLRTMGSGAGTPFMNPTPEIERWAARMQELGIKPEMEVYSHAMIRDVENLIAKGLLEEPYYVNLVLGMAYQGAVPATPKVLNSLVDFLPPSTLVNVTATAASQLPLTTIGMAMGCCVRVGLEDNIYYRKGELAASNAQLVERTVRIARELEKEPASPAEARAILGLQPLDAQVAAPAGHGSDNA